MRTARLALPLLPLLAAACAPAYPEPQEPSLLSGASYGRSSSASSFSSPSGPSIPSHGDGRGALVVRPDLACVAFVLRVEMADPKAAVDLLEKATLAVKERFRAATGGAATMRMLGASVAPAGSYSKAKEDEKAPSFVVTVDGAVEVPLGAESDYWTRAKLVSALVEASRMPGPIAPSAGKGAPRIEHTFGAPEIKLRDPESYRAELVKRWIERARAFARVAESQAAPLHLVSCDPPSAITQSFLSLEQIALSLPASCRIDIARPAP